MKKVKLRMSEFFSYDPEDNHKGEVFHEKMWLLRDHVYRIVLRINHYMVTSYDETCNL